MSWIPGWSLSNLDPNLTFLNFICEAAVQCTCRIDVHLHCNAVQIDCSGTQHKQQKYSMQWSEQVLVAAG